MSHKCSKCGNDNIERFIVREIQNYYLRDNPEVGWHIRDRGEIVESYVECMECDEVQDWGYELEWH